MLKSSFVVKNIATKIVRVFSSYGVKPGQEVDLFDVVPSLTEDKLMSELTKGDLGVEVYEKGNLQVVKSYLFTFNYQRYLAANGRSDWFDPDVEKVLYVSVDGDDEMGDGTPARPFRQPQAAIDFIRSVGGAPRGVFIIQCGAGEFEAPYMSWTPPSECSIAVIGDRSSPIMEFTGPCREKTPPETPSFSPTAHR